MAVLDRDVNPSIASHGGHAELAGIEGATAYLRLGGGCQGCGMATVTLSQGIEVAITQAVPEIDRVVDVTDHASGTNPYFEPAKKSSGTIGPTAYPTRLRPGPAHPATASRTSWGATPVASGRPPLRSDLRRPSKRLSFRSRRATEPSHRLPLSPAGEISANADRASAQPSTSESDASSVLGHSLASDRREVLRQALMELRRQAEQRVHAVRHNWRTAHRTIQTAS